jgi:hypothetical protein
MKLWVFVSALGTLALGTVSLVVSCSSGSGNGGTNNNVDAGPGCSVNPGQLPPSDCESSNNQCSTTGGCSIDESKCGSKSTCLPMATNSGNVQNFRIRRLTIAAPASLSESAGGVIQEGVVDKGISLKAPQCGEGGDGSFNWLLSVDRTANTIKTGGAPPSSDPFGQGFCFVNETTPSGILLKPITIPATFSGASFSTAPVTTKLFIPVFVMGDPNNLVVLPISNSQFQNVTISPDGNCIGSLNYNALDSMCIDIRQDCSKWHTAGSLGGFITLEDADAIPIALVGNKSLCTFLTAATADQLAPDGLHCKRGSDGKIILKGDYCSSPAGPGGCQDSYWLAATFAAAAIKINDGTGIPQCQGANNQDAGTDSGAKDAAGD